MQRSTDIINRFVIGFGQRGRGGGGGGGVRTQVVLHSFRDDRVDNFINLHLIHLSVYL